MSGTGRRTARRVVSPTGVLALLLPLLTIGGLGLVRPDAGSSRARPPDVVPVSRLDLVCPSARGPDPVLAVAPARDVTDGEAAVETRAGQATDIEVRPDTVTVLAGRDRASFVRAAGEVAAQLLAARFGAGGLAATECDVPRPTSWFTGVGADAGHASVLELTNPDAGPAVADVTVLGRSGVVDVPELRGLTVQGGRSLRVDLTEAVPTTSELALQVVVSRGRLGVSVDDGIPALGTRPASRDWLPAAAEPATDLLLLGVVEGQGRDTMTVANPGADETRVEVRIVTADAVFVPEGMEEITVAPGSVEAMPLTDQLRGQIAEDALGLQVTSTSPVTAGLASVVAGDLSHAAAVEPTAAATTALVPPGESSVVLAASERAGAAVVSAYDGGRLLTEERVELSQGSGATVELPRDTSLVRVAPRRTSVAGAIVTRGDGATVSPLRELIRTALVPDVRPGLPE